MNENQLRDTKRQPKSSNVSNSLNLPSPIASTSVLFPKNILDTDSSSLNLINFHTSMGQTIMDVYDPEYEKIQPDEWARLCQEKCNRDISLIEGLKNPEKVCPRTKWDFSYSRPANTSDLSFMWYRIFVTVADWANNIPEFRMLPDDDKTQLFKLNFTVLSCVAFGQCEVKVNSNTLPLGNGSYIGHDQPG